MSLVKYAVRYVRWYHIVGLLLGVTVLIGVFWWYKERERFRFLSHEEDTDLVEVA